MGKIQFNATSGKIFRATFGKFHNAQHSLAQSLCEVNDSLKNYRGILSTDESQLARLEKGDNVGIIRTREDIEKSREDAKSNITRLEKERVAMSQKAKKASEDTLALVTEELYKGYQSIGTDNDIFATAIADWFKANGFADATPENCEVYTRWFGMFDKKNSNRKKVETTYLRTGMTKSNFTSAWCEAMADELQRNGIIHPFKYTYEVKKNK